MYCCVQVMYVINDMCMYWYAVLQCMTCNAQSENEIVDMNKKSQSRLIRAGHFPPSLSPSPGTLH